MHPVRIAMLVGKQREAKAIHAHLNIDYVDEMRRTLTEPSGIHPLFVSIPENLLAKLETYAVSR